MSTLWGGRMSEPPSDELMEFTASLPFDRQLAQADIAGSRAHVRGLEHAGILNRSEAQTLLQALDQVGAELASGAFVFAATDEDIHTAVERRVTQLAGEVGEKLHTGRSRNDQVATDLRLYAKGEMLSVAKAVLEMQEVLLGRARDAGDAVIAGYTHLQRAQPVLLAHHLLAHGWAFARDVDRILAARERLDVSPLGAGALGGTSLLLQPAFTATELGFAEPFQNSLDAVSDRDFAAECLFVLALLGVHLSRLGEEIIFYASQEAAFIRLADAYSTGSSMLPHKKNPDIAELARAKSGRLIGNLTGLLAVLKGLPLAYNRDLQEDKEPMFDSFKQVRLGLAAMRGLAATMEFDYEKMAAAASDPTLASVDLADFLVRKGVPFREAHSRIAGLVARYLDSETDADTLGSPTFEDLVRADPDLGEEAAELCDIRTALSARQSPGGGGPEAVAKQMQQFASQLRADTARIQALA